MPTLHDLIESRFADEVAFLADLVRQPSDNPPGDCAAHAERAAELLEALGFDVERHVVPVDVVRTHGMKSVTNLVVRHRFGAGPVIALNAHGDVVPPGDGWTREPYGAEIVDGWMYGRGVAVSKSDFATYAFALDALKRTGKALKGTVELHFTYDEEIGGDIGPRWLRGAGDQQTRSGDRRRVFLCGRHGTQRLSASGSRDLGSLGARRSTVDRR